MNMLNASIVGGKLRVWGLIAAVTVAAGLIPGFGQAADAGAADSDQKWVAAMLAQRAALRGGQKVWESAWHMAGPLQAKSFADAQFPEKGVSLEANGTPAKPWKAKNFPNGRVHHLQAGGSTATYLYRTVVAKAPGPLRISLGTDDGIEFWFNGEKLVSKDVPRGVSPDQDIVKVTLRAGTNTVLLKVFNQTGDCGFYYNTDQSTLGAAASMAGKFPEEAGLFGKYAPAEGWFAQSESTKIEQEAISKLLQRLPGAGAAKQAFEALVQAKAAPEDPAWLKLFLPLARLAEQFERALAEIQALNLAPLRLAVADLSDSFPGKYPGEKYLPAIVAFEQELPKLKKALASGDPGALDTWSRFKEVQREALLANPLLNFEEILLVRRRENNLALPQNWQGNSSLNPRVENEIVKLPVRAKNAPLRTFYKPAENYYVGDVDLHYDGDRLLFSSIGSHQHWQIFEIKIDGTGLRQITPTDEPDIDNYDSVYLPDGRIIYDSSSTFQGVPCVGGADYVANLHLMNADGTHIRRLCFDQDNDWYPVVMPSGRVMYLRWEYTDSAHYFSRVLMSMNPDGTGQVEMHSSNSYWPNGLFYARPLPGSSTKFAAIVSGHHGVPRMGELVLFDVSKGRQEDTGAIQRIPGYGKPVKGIIKDTLVDESWPKFLHPYPLSEKYFLVSCKPDPAAPWGVYLVDIFDNLLPLKIEPGWALFEPLPLRKTERPPVIFDKVKPGEKNATVYLHDIYAGQGLRGVPRGTVKSLRVFQYEYSYRNQGGHYFVGMEGGWDVRRMIGTVDVETDGSAFFSIPANTPVAVQPLDAEGKALQQMRSWFVGMPGEAVSCVGCHETQNSTTALQLGVAARKAPAEPKAWRGPKRGFGFVREVQPVLDKDPASVATTANPTGPTLRIRRSFPPAAASPPCPACTSRCIRMCGATARRAITTRLPRWSFTPIPACWCKCSAKAITT